MQLSWMFAPSSTTMRPKSPRRLAQYRAGMHEGARLDDRHDAVDGVDLGMAEF